MLRMHAERPLHVGENYLLPPHDHLYSLDIKLQLYETLECKLQYIQLQKCRIQLCVTNTHFPCPTLLCKLQL